MCRGVLNAYDWKVLTMSTQAEGSFGVGTEPPPDSTEPSRSVVIWPGSAVTAPRSACVIWPILSSSVIRRIRSATRRSVESRGSRYGRPCAVDTAVSGTRARARAPATYDLIGRTPVLLGLGGLTSLAR